MPAAAVIVAARAGRTVPKGLRAAERSNEAAMEAAMSSPIIPLDQAWNGVPRRAGHLRQLRRGNPIRELDGAEHNLADAVLRAGRTSPEVGNPDGGGSWGRMYWET